MNSKYWNEKIETMPAEEIKESATKIIEGTSQSLL